MSNFLEDLANEAKALDLEIVPTEAGSERLRKAAVELYETSQEIKRLESELKTKSALFNTLSNRTLPDIMSEIGQDSIGLPDAGEFGVDIVSANYYHANIPKDWEEDRRTAAFSLLDRKGAGDLIRNIVTMQFTKGENDKVKAFLAAISDPRFDELLMDVIGEQGTGVNDLTLPEPTVEMTVPWNTLTAYVKEQHIAGTLHELWMEEVDPPVDPVETLGATIGVVVKIKPRKAKR